LPKLSSMMIIRKSKSDTKKEGIKGLGRSLELPFPSIRLHPKAAKYQGAC
jgi:hypothetical protein